MSQNRSLSEIFENLDVDYQMLISLGKIESFYRPRNQSFSHVIGVYFISFFIEHPVHTKISYHQNSPFGPLCLPNTIQTP